jgi:hypothetical protein
LFIHRCARLMLTFAHRVPWRARSLYVARAAMQAQGDWRAFWAGLPVRAPTPTHTPTTPRASPPDKSRGLAAALD